MRITRWFVYLPAALIRVKLLKNLSITDARLASELVREYCAFTGAPEVLNTEKSNALEVSNPMLLADIELAIMTSSKRFLSVPLVQQVVHGIYTGSLVFSRQSANALIDIYSKSSEVYVYDPYEAGWLDHGRLRVPKYRKWQEFSSQFVLLALFIATLSCKRRSLSL